MKKLMVSLLLMIGSYAGVFAQTTNLVINLSHINENFYDFNGAVENQSFSVDGVDMTMDMSIVQEGGKLFADGSFSASAYYSGYHVYLDADIVAKGTLSESPAGLNAKMTMTMKGIATVSGYGSVPFSATTAEDVTMNGSGDMDGIVKGKVSVKGGGSSSFSETISWDAPAGYGIRDTVLNVPISGGSKLAGTATINLPSGETVSFAITGSFNPKTSQYKISLKGVTSDTFSTGSTLSLAVDSGGTVASVSGTVLGQKANYKAGKK